MLIRKLLIFSTWGVRNRLTDAGEIALVHPAKQQQKGSASPSYSDLTPPPPTPTTAHLQVRADPRDCSPRRISEHGTDG